MPGILLDDKKSSKIVKRKMLEEVKDEEEERKTNFWINPKPTMEKITLYNVLEKNEFFELLEHISTKSGFNSFLMENLRKISSILPFHIKSSYWIQIIVV